MNRFADRVAVITGAASGIGMAVAQAMAAEGAIVVGLDLDTRPSEVELVKCDVTDADGVDRAIAEVVSEHARIDVLVTAAGVWQRGTVINTSVEAWDAVMAVNLRGAFLVSRAALRAMSTRHRGAIVHLGSIAGIVGGRDSAAYGASKGGVVALTRAMALDHASIGVRVNCVCPGMTQTPMLDATEAGLSQSERKALHASRVASHPLGRIGTPRDVVPAVLYLASDDSDWVTGAILTVDGGYTAG